MKIELEAIGPGGNRPIDITYTIKDYLPHFGALPFDSAVGFTDLFGNEGWTIQRSKVGIDTVLLEHQRPVHRLNREMVRESRRLAWRTFDQATRHFYDDDEIDREEDLA